MLMTPSNTTSEPFSRSVAQKLENCDRISTFSEAGSYYVAGFKDSNRVVYAHFSNEAAYNSYCGYDSEKSDYDDDNGYNRYR